MQLAPHLLRLIGPGVSRVFVFSQIEPLFGSFYQSSWVYRPGEVIIHPDFKTLFPIDLHGVRCHRNNGNIMIDDGRFAVPDFRGGFKSVHFRHLNIHKHKIVRDYLEGPDRFLAFGHGIGAIAELFQNVLCDLLVDPVFPGSDIVFQIVW